MSSEILVGLVAGVFGVLAAAIPAYIAQRRQPSRLTTEAVSLVDTQGNVVRTLKEEIDRLNAEVDAARAEAGHAIAEEEKLKDRVRRLEGAMRAAGLDPAAV